MRNQLGFYNVYYNTITLFLITGKYAEVKETQSMGDRALTLFWVLVAMRIWADCVTSLSLIFSSRNKNTCSFSYCEDLEIIGLSQVGE